LGFAESSFREGWVKTGWASWEQKWRPEVFRRHTVEFHTPASIGES